MVPFAGWEMPVQYQGVIEEHWAVRRSVGLFDVSHMGAILLRGAGAEALLDSLSTNKIAGKKPGTATYTVWPHAEGGSVDDVIIFRETDEAFYVVANAGNRMKDLAHLQAAAIGHDVEIEDLYADHGILALQGPRAMELAEALFPEAAGMKPMRCATFAWQGQPVRLSTTGYTGSGGCELLAHESVIVALWEELLDRGQSLNIQPIGLAARDTLRLEMGFALYGHELSDEIFANESVSAWTVRWSKEAFRGKAAMEEREASSSKRHCCAVELVDKGIAREGYEVYLGDSQIGVVTSGTQSPCLQKSIALLLLDQPLAEGSDVEIQVRKRRVKAKVCSLPFINPHDYREA
jgi:aminomethyltransferase